VKSFASIAGFVAIVSLCTAAARAQDRAKDPTTDPAHFKVELENDRVRVLHVKIEPNGKGELHELDDLVVVPLADYESTMKTPGGEAKKVERIAGKPAWVPGGRREVEAGARGVDALLIEIKHPAAPK